MQQRQVIDLPHIERHSRKEISIDSNHAAAANAQRPHVQRVQIHSMAIQPRWPSRWRTVSNHRNVYAGSADFDEDSVWTHGVGTFILKCRSTVVPVDGVLELKLTGFPSVVNDLSQAAAIGRALLWLRGSERTSFYEQPGGKA